MLSSEDTIQIEAEKHKTIGNTHYKESRFEDAIESYSKAILLKSSSIYLSNRSAAYYEMGRYTEAILDADAALALNQESNFKQKLITRIAHACILSNQLYPLRNLHLSVDDKQKVDAFIKRSTNSTPFSDESILKLSRLTITPMANGEYFPIGHDSATSALAGAPIRVTSNESDEEGVEFREDIRHRVDLNHCTKDNPLGVLFGGVGDARHVLITLVDFYEQMKKFPKSRRNNVKISLLLNDLNPCVLARIVVLFLALEEMSHFKSYDRSQPMFSFLLTYCTLTYCGLGIPEQICVKLIDVISECSKNEDWMVKLPMFKLTNLSTRAAIRHVFKSWLANIATKKLTYCLDRYDIGEHDQEPAYYSSEVLREKKIKEQENYRQQILELTDDRILITVPDDKYGSTVEEKRQYMLKMTAAMCDRELKMDISVDISFLTASKLFLLPLDYPFNSHTNFHKDKDQMSFRDAIKQVRESKKEKPNKLMERVAKHCLDTFVTNPLMIDYTFWKENKDELTLSFHPADFCQAFFAMNYIQQPKHVHDIYDFFGSIFFRVSRCFEFSNNFDIELNVGDVNKTCFMIDSAWKSERIENGLLTKFHRIFMSNIADYCGLLTSFVSVVPLMEKNCDIPCWMFSNVLLNTGIWKNYEQYIYSSTLINGSERVKELLDVYLVSGGIWDDFQVWGPQKFTLPSRNSLIIWLHRLFLSICYPAIRDPNAVCFEYSPMTLQVFLLTLTRLYKLGVPAHWLSSVIETLLSTSKLSTAVKPPSSSPLDQSTAATSNITSSYLDVFQQELSCLLSIWSRHPDISFPILYSNLPDDIHTFIVTDVFIPNTLVTGTVCCPHLAMLLIHPEEEAIVEIGQFYNHVKTKKGSRRMHLFSCLKRWKNGDISFSASKSFIDGLRMENWMVIPLRIDSWKMVSLSGSVAGLKQMD